jgi:hypothetical protein
MTIAAATTTIAGEAMAMMATRGAAETTLATSHRQRSANGHRRGRRKRDHWCSEENRLQNQSNQIT